ncbi:LysR family transcriptional regulator [Gilvimarinus sp. F26214L]|uniref:LysR family transcriptional regulator n=1 Tax=Gilvimarinus sp. DZF01 TaxID=3461371 RepID=UPI004046183A
MDLNKIDLNLFVVLDSIYSESSLSGAAKRLYVTQPAVSAALARLRAIFDDPLFVRTGRRMVPTPTTESIIGPVREALSLMRSSVDKSYRFVPATERKTFRLSMNDLSESIVLPGLYQVLEKEAPNMRLQVVQLNRRDALKSLAAGQLDFVMDAPLLANEQLCHAPFFGGEYVGLVRAGHPIAGEELTLERYLALSHLHISSRISGPGYVDYALERINAKRRIAVRTQHYLMVPQLISATDLCATVPSYFANIPGTVTKKLPFELEPQGHHLYWHRSRDSDPAIQWIKEVILRLKDLGPEPRPVATLGA